MFNPDLHAAHASCEEGEFTYDETTEEAKRQKGSPDRRHSPRHTGRRQQDAGSRQAGWRYHKLDVG